MAVFYTKCYLDSRVIRKLFATLRNAPADGHVEIDIARVSERPKSSRKPARPARTARVARAEVHYRELTLPPTIAGRAPVTLWAVHVRESAPPEGEKPLEWFLLTSVRVACLDAALETVGHYLRRWRVEDFFRVLKSGCRAEHLGFHSAERLERALTIQAVIAWRLMLMTLFGSRGPRVRRRAAVQRHRAALPHRLRRRRRVARTAQPRRRGAARRAARRVPESQA